MGVVKLQREAEQMDLGLFPGMISPDKGEKAPRLKVLISVTLLDRHTGEKVSRATPFETDESSQLLPWVDAAIAHPRLREDITSFAEGRDG